jgi:hypothetical protein
MGTLEAFPNPVLQLGHFGHARGALGGKEIHQHHLATGFLQIEDLAIERGDLELGGRLAGFDEGGRVFGGFGQGRNRQQAEKQRK